MSEAFAALLRMDRRLVEAGFPPISDWWKETLRAVYERRVRQAVIRVGRRGGKSTTVCRIAVCEALFGSHVVPPGDIGVVAIVSTRREEAAERLRTIRAILDALGVGYRNAGETIELTDRPICFRVFVASLAGVVGFTSVCVIADEVSRWRDSESGANPASEVLASIRPTMATQRNAKLFLISSPLGPDDAHARAFAQGDTDFQHVAHAPTWVANPTVSEAETRALEPDDRIWRREYAAEPQASTLAAFDTDAVDRAFTPREAIRRGQRVLIMDPSSGRSDAWTWAVAGMSTDARGEFLQVDLVDGLPGAFWRNVSGDQIVTRLAALATEHGVSEVFSDQREAYMLEAAFSAAGLRFTSMAWNNANKIASVEALRRHLRERTIALPDSAQLRRELLAFEERITPSGSLTFAGRGAHDDFVALLLTLSMVEVAGELPAARDAFEGQPSAPNFLHEVEGSWRFDPNTRGF